MDYCKLRRPSKFLLTSWRQFNSYHVHTREGELFLAPRRLERERFALLVQYSGGIDIVEECW
jgi:hypothetical protein